MSSKIEKSKNKFDNRNLEKINSSKKKISVKEAGITLVALVITIIVLLILAMISISSAVSGNGIFARAQKAGNLWRDVERNEDTSLNEISNKLGEYTDKIPDTPGGDEPNTTPGELTDFYCRGFDTNNDGYVDTLVYSHSKDYNFTTDIIDTKFPGGNDSSIAEYDIYTADLGIKNITFNPKDAKFEFGYLQNSNTYIGTQYKHYNGADNSLRYLCYYATWAGNWNEYNIYALKNIIVYDDICLEGYSCINESGYYCQMFPSAAYYCCNQSGYNIIGNGKIIINDVTKIKEMFGDDTDRIEQSWLNHLDIRDKNFYYPKVDDSEIFDETLGYYRSKTENEKQQELEAKTKKDIRYYL